MLDGKWVNESYNHERQIGVPHVVCNRDFLWNFIVLYFLSSLSPGQQPTKSINAEPTPASIFRKDEKGWGLEKIKMKFKCEAKPFVENICRKHPTLDCTEVYITYIQTNQDHHHLVHESQDSYKSCKWSCICCQAIFCNLQAWNPRLALVAQQQHTLKTLINARAQPRA